MTANIFEKIKGFYKECDKPTFFFSLAMVNQVIGFTPRIPSFIFYVIILLYSVYCFTKPHTICLPMMVFLIYIPIELLLSQPDRIFKSWERYVLLTLILMSNSPLFQGDINRLYRFRMINIILFMCAVLGIGSFIGRFIGINYGFSYMYTDVHVVGTFGGLTIHSMLLGPIAGLGSLYMTASWFKTKKRVYAFAAFLCLISVMLSESRASLVAAIAGNTMMLYKLSGTGSNFIKKCVFIILILSLTFPFWGTALDGIKEKNQMNLNNGSSFDSRASKWEARISEFKSSPIIGIGFASVDLATAEVMNEVSDSGIVETGSSWLCILSMTGIIGALLLIPIFLKSFISAWKSRTEYSSVIVGMLVLFYIHMLAEGYVLAGGSFLAFCLWLAVGCGYDCEYYNEKTSEY